MREARVEGRGERRAMDGKYLEGELDRARRVLQLLEKAHQPLCRGGAQPPPPSPPPELPASPGGEGLRAIASTSSLSLRIVVAAVEEGEEASTLQPIPRVTHPPTQQ